MSRIGFVIDALKTLNIKKDTTLALVQAALRAQHEVFIIEKNSLQYTDRGVVGYALPVNTVHVDCSQLIQQSMDIQEVLDLRSIIELNEEQLDVVFMRQDPPVDHKYLATVLLLSYWEMKGVRVLNPTQALLTLNEKLNIMQFPDFITNTIVATEINTLINFVRLHKTVILKPLHAMGGEGIVKININDSNMLAVIEQVTHSETEMVMAQKCLDIFAEGDKRILFLNGKPLSHALARFPKENHFIANLAAGGSGKVVPLTKRDKLICEAVAPFCIKYGLAIVGLDIINGCITEVNLTSPTCLREIQTVTQQDYALDLMQTI